MIRILTVILITFCTSESWAHKFKCFATFEDGKISGYAWFSAGTRPVSVPIIASGPDGAVLYSGTTTPNGEFSFSPNATVDHLIKVNAGEGHVASFTVYADDLLELTAIVSRDPAVSPEAAIVETTANSAVNSLDIANESTIIKAVTKEIGKLRRDLDAFKERQRMQDVIGGVGYLFGVAGIAFYFLGVRRKENN